MNIGIALNKLRKARNIRQKELAKSTGLSATYISQIEGGTRNPTMATLTKIANFYKIPLPFVFWLNLQESEIPEDKRDFFRMLKPGLDRIILDIFIDKTDQLDENK